MNDRRRLRIDGSLVKLVGGVGSGIQNAGNALVNLGDKKVAAAKADALKKEKDAKTIALGQATASKNRALNPDAVKKINAAYGIDENSPLAQAGAPTKANADLRLVDLGKADKEPERSLKFVKEDLKGNLVQYFGNGDIEDSGKKAPKREFKPTVEQTTELNKLLKEQSKYKKGSKNFNTYENKIKKITRESTETTTTKSKKDENMVAPSSLGVAFNQKTIDLFKPLGIMTQIGDKWVINKSKYEQYKNKAANIGIK